MLSNPTSELCTISIELQKKFNLKNWYSLSTISRILHRCNFSLKKVVNQSRHNSYLERKEYVERLSRVFLFPGQLVFLDESSFDARCFHPTKGWGISESVEMRVNSCCGHRFSSLIALCDGILAWTSCASTYSRSNFHSAFLRNILPLCNP